MRSSEDVLVQVENVSKKYCRSLKRSVLYGAQDACRDIVGLPLRTKQLRQREFWALDDVSFQIRRGECLGVVGLNGAGKSTLLKLLNRIFLPDNGKIIIRGRVGALIELGAGFHPLLSGRENIYISGAILGLSKKEIDGKFEEIVAFAELDDFIDTPVKFYSSGMYVRLGFAVAAHLEPDVLLIDEVLAVGDAGFRAKCYNLLVKKLPHMAVCLVSHSMPQMARLCQTGIWLNNGGVASRGSITEVIGQYTSRLCLSPAVAVDGGLVRLHKVEFLNQHGRPSDEVSHGAPASLRLLMSVDQKCRAYHIYVSFFSNGDEYIAEATTAHGFPPIQATGQMQEILLTFDNVQISPGRYAVSLLVVDAENTMHHLYWVHQGWKLQVVGTFLSGAPTQVPFTLRLTEGGCHIEERAAQKNT